MYKLNDYFIIGINKNWNPIKKIINKKLAFINYNN